MTAHSRLTVIKIFRNFNQSLSDNCLSFTETIFRPLWPTYLYVPDILIQYTSSNEFVTSYALCFKLVHWRSWRYFEYLICSLKQSQMALPIQQVLTSNKVFSNIISSKFFNAQPKKKTIYLSEMSNTGPVSMNVAHQTWRCRHRIV